MSKHACSQCGQLKTVSELNGYDPVNGYFSKAYCRRLAECKSPSAERAMKRLRSELETAEKELKL